MKGPGRSTRGFTLIEILVVVIIVGVLASLILPALINSRRMALVTKCHNNMREIHNAIVMYRDDYIAQGGEIFPPSLSALVAKGYIADRKIFLCPLDGSGGAQGGKPDGAGIDQYDELRQIETSPHSYMYEMAGARCTWGWQGFVGPLGKEFVESTLPSNMDGDRSVGTWGEVKLAQLNYGDQSLHTNTNIVRGYPPDKFPVLRCFWHTDDPNTNDKQEISNLAYTGRVFTSAAYWETLIPGIPPP